jgi:hypothetical protein
MAIQHTVSYPWSTSQGVKEITETVSLTRQKAIRFKCLECSNADKKEIRECPIKDCALYPFRPYQ